MFAVPETLVRLALGVVVAVHLSTGVALADEITGARPATDETVLAELKTDRPRRTTTKTAGHQGGIDDYKAGPGCSIQCIVGGFAYARGVGAELVVTTDTPAQIWIVVWDDDGYSHTSASFSTEATSHSVHLDDLEPGHVYQAMAVAEDSQGHASHAYGTFETLRRHVEIEVGNATLLDHVFADNSFSKDVWVEGQWAPTYSADGLESQGSTLDWGTNTILVTDTDRHLDLAVQLFEANEDPPPLCQAQPTPDDPWVDDNDCYAAAFAFLHAGDDDLDERPPGATSWTEHQLHRTLQLPGGGALPPGYGAVLDFTVDVTLDVFYS